MASNGHIDSRYPDALICDLETLRDTPAEMTAGGVGDMLAVFVSFPDWYLAHRLGMDSGYSELAKHLVGPLDEILLAADGIRGGDLESVAILAKIIALGGLAMSLSRATTPMSGFEHVMSHVYDQSSEIDHKHCESMAHRWRWLRSPVHKCINASWQSSSLLNST